VQSGACTSPINRLPAGTELSVDGKNYVISSELPIEGGIAFFVYKVRRKPECGLEFALKQILCDPKDPEIVRLCMEEVRILESLSHPNIVRCYGKELKKDNNFYVVTEWCDGLSISKYFAPFPSLHRKIKRFKEACLQGQRTRNRPNWQDG